jgi:predicted TIM-barrel enzyme
MTHPTSGSRPLFVPASGPVIVAALHLPDLSVARATSMAFLEDYVLANARVFAEAGIPALMLQDQTREPGPAAVVTSTVTAVLGRLIRKEFPGMALGIIVQAHDAQAPIAIAHAAGASFVRLKVFVGAAMTMEGPKNALALAARSYRHDLRRDDLAILADVFDRTSVPLIDVAPEEAAQAAVKLGADGLILTGATFAESLERVRKAKGSGIARPILIGGSVTSGNVAQALGVADGAIVSTSLMRDGAAPGELLQWDADKTRRFMDLVRAMAGTA